MEGNSLTKLEGNTPRGYGWKEFHKNNRKLLLLASNEINKMRNDEVEVQPTS